MHAEHAHSPAPSFAHACAGGGGGGGGDGDDVARDQHHALVKHHFREQLEELGQWYERAKRVSSPLATGTALSLLGFDKLDSAAATLSSAPGFSHVPPEPLGEVPVAA